MPHDPGWSPAAPRKSVLLRLSPALHKALARWAKEEMRSIQGQMEYVLKKALADAGRGKR